MHPVVQQHARRARFPGQDCRNRLVRVTHVRQETHWYSPDPCSIVDHGRFEVFVMAQRAPEHEALRGWQVFSDSDERVRLQEDDALTATAEDAAFLP